MARVFICEQGHRWHVAADGSAASADAAPACPVCGEAHVTVTADAPVGSGAAGATTRAWSVAGAVAPAELPAVPGYEILAEVGRGGMGVVYQARHLLLKRLAALKMVLSGSHAGPEELTRFRIEAEAVARLQHPSIVQIYEVGEHLGRPYLALEFVEGGSLAERVARRPPAPDEAAALVRDLARAVHFAHQRGVVHRDLKPANILLTADGAPKITDFGLAKQLDAGPGQTNSGALLGTPSYMAPEQAGGRPQDVGPATDVYALGAVLYELLAGRPPFHGDTPLQTAGLVVSEEPTPPSRLRPGLARNLETICLKCLEKEPRRRYGSAAELADDLERHLQGDAILARPPGAVGRLLRWAGRQPAFAATLIAVGIFYLNHLVLLNVVHLPGEGGSWHRFVTGLALVWAAGAGLFQRLSRRPAWHTRAVFGWATMDVLLLTAMLVGGAGPRSPFVVGYLLLTAGAALRFRTALVWYVTAIGMASYAGVVVYTAVFAPSEMISPHMPFIFLLSLAVMGLTQHLLLRRLRAGSAGPSKP
jgi:serine/threonine-protein kinase